MSATLIIRDETTSGVNTGTFTLEFPTEHTTVREVIRERVYQEVQDYNRRTEGDFRGLVQPEAAEVALNGTKPRARRQIDWKKQFERACEAFEANRVLILVDDRQAEALDEPVEIKRGTAVTFLKLLPLVGG